LLACFLAWFHPDSRKCVCFFKSRIITKSSPLLLLWQIQTSNQCWSGT
jgi:hypothetical protein